MWNQEPTRHPNVPQNQQVPVPAPSGSRPGSAIEARATLGSSVFIKGTLAASEDLTVDGRLEGRITLPEHPLTVGPNAKITAEIVAKTITVFGSVKGNVTAHDRLDIRSTASVEGEVICTRISIQEGAAFCGKVTMGNRKAKANGADTDSPAMLAAAV